METISCKICGSNKAKSLFKVRDFRLDDKDNEYKYVECKNCGVIFQNPRLSSDEMEKHYNLHKIYNTKAAAKGVKKALYEFGLRKRADVIIRRIKSGRLLDIGCGTGSFIRYLRDNSTFEVYGTEINEKTISELKEKHELDVRFGNLCEINFSEDFFDAITLWDVIEHLPNPQRTLNEIKRILKPEGILVIRVPNGNSLDFKIFGKYWAGLDAPRHYYVFTRETLRRLLNEVGFEINSHQKDIGSYLNFVLSLEFWLTDKNVNSNIRSKLLNVMRHFSLRLILFPIMLIKDYLFQGTSLTIIAKAQNRFKPTS